MGVRVIVSFGLAKLCEFTTYGEKLIFGVVHWIPCEYLITDPAFGIICVALLFTTPLELELGEATVVFAKTGV